MDKLADLRKSYERAVLDEDTAALNPFVQFKHWFEQAMMAKVPEPNAMTLATADANGRPSARIVLVKDADERGLVWYTNYQSRKSQELQANPFASLQFHWVELERVVRIEGSVQAVSAEESDAYFQSRPLASRWGAWASPQSQVVASRETLERALEAARERFGERPPRPPHWGGFRLTPLQWEFWQGRPSRLHDRLLYLREHAQAAWRRERLAP